MNIQIRHEEKKDRKIVEILTREAFWKEEKIKEIGIGCNEHYLAHTLREAPEFIQELDFVAVVEDQIVGNIMYTIATLELTNNTQLEVLCFGPLSVKLEFQNKGVGSALVKHSLKEATLLGFDAVVIFGHPTYYSKFGFKEAKEFNISTKDGKNFPAFMAIELIEGSLHGLTASFYEADAFNIDAAKAIEFDKLFGKYL